MDADSVKGVLGSCHDDVIGFDVAMKEPEQMQFVQSLSPRTKEA